MFYSLTGKLVLTTSSSAVIDCGGVAFLCSTTVNTLRDLPQPGNQVMLYTVLNVKEDALDLYGFSTQAELDFYKLLVGVSGVGPKSALAVLSDFTPDRLALCIAAGDIKSLTRAQGIGPKAAQRIVLELKDKVGGLGNEAVQNDVAAVGVSSAAGNAADAVAALTVLGYSQSEAALAVGRLDHALPVEELIKGALKALAAK